MWRFDTRARESDAALPALVAVFGEYVRMVDLHWLPDGSGFMVARTTSCSTRASTIIGRDGTGERLLVRNGEIPAWRSTGS